MTRFYQHKKPFSRLSWFFIAMIGAGTVSIIHFRLSGGEVGADGMLNEPFYLVGIGYSLMIAGIAGLMGNVLFGIYKSERDKVERSRADRSKADWSKAGRSNGGQDRGETDRD